LLTLKKIQLTYGGQSVLHNVDVTINEGEFVFLTGQSGSGKSTLLKLLYRELEQYEGDIYIENQLLKTMPKYITRRMVGTIFQSYELLSQKNALENVMLAGEVIGRDEKEIKKEAYLLLEKVGLKGKEERFPHQLSGGEQQRVAIARALLNRPKLLLGDEPTGNLDPDNAKHIMKLLKEINEKENITMLIVTHSTELLKMFPSKQLVIEEGRVREI